jgi:rhamnulokinase
LHVVGGGSQNRLLNRLTASASGMVVAAGPVEATALGNILIQAVASGELGSLKDLREVIRNSYTIEEFEPEDAAPWAEALQRYENLTR